MARIASTPDAILLAVMKRLVDRRDLTGLTESTCYIEHLGEPSANPGEIFCGLSMTGGTFDQANIDGGGTVTVTVKNAVRASLRTIDVLDDMGTAESFLTNQNSGLFVAMTGIMKALAVHDLADADDNQILRQPIFPASFGDPEQAVIPGEAAIFFDIEWDWDLS